MIYQDLTDQKQAAIGMVEAASWEIVERRQMYFDHLSQMVAPFKVDQAKLMQLVRSQILVGNTDGAVKVLGLLPERRLSKFGVTVLSPVWVPVLAVACIVGIPYRLFRWVLENV